MGQFCAKHDFFFYCSITTPPDGYKSPRLLTWFVGSLGLVLHRSVTSYSKPPVLKGEPPEWCIKRQFLNVIAPPTPEMGGAWI